ncbi:MAG: TetR family transcriptional regulator, partial [Ilumatobacteraceae bacterium]
MSTASEEPDREMHGTRNTKAGGPRKTTRKARAREEDIFRAAARIFHRKGYAATSLQDIADEVGLL